MEEVGTFTTLTIRATLSRGIAQRGERIGGFARLADEERPGGGRERRLAVAELGGDIDLDRQARQLLEPVFRDMAGVGGGAAGDERQAVDAGEIKPAAG